MSATNLFLSILQSRIVDASDPKTKTWWERYLRGVTPFLGVNLTTIRAILRETADEQGMVDHDPSDLMVLAQGLFGGRYTEEKLAGILVLQDLVAERAPWTDRVELIERIFQRGLIGDWNVCDWVCVRVLGPMVQANGLACADRIGEWRAASSLWQARASAVAFVYLTAEPSLAPVFMASCDTLIRRPERFAKTAVGWVLRELSKTDPAAIAAFVESHGGLFSREVVANAGKRLHLDVRARLRTLPVRVVTAARRDVASWLTLAGEVEDLFGPMEHEPGFRETLERVIGDKRGLCVRNHGAETALAGAILISTSKNRIGWLAVSDEARGQGVGSALLAMALKRLDSSRPVSVQTFAVSVTGGESARRLYGRFGFREKAPAGPNPAGVPTVIMERPSGGEELA